MPPDTSPLVGNSYFWESQRINHISYSFCWRGTGAGFIFGCWCCTCTACEQGWARGTGHCQAGSAPSHFPSGPDLWCWLLEGDFPMWPQPLGSCFVLGRWQVGSMARPAGSECSSSRSGWQDCGTGSWHCLVLPAPLAAIKQQMHLLGQITHCWIQLWIPVLVGGGTAAAATLRLGKSLREAPGGGWAAGLDPAQAPARCPSSHQSHRAWSVPSQSSSSSWPSTPKQTQHPKTTSAPTNSPEVGRAW